ncbi:MAG TPA: DUF1573 domain-containing protein [Phaeodactylibacter sp.]|nr:DUF1573 domain-containing protein [Phaeodactylibacter sp.]
MKKISLSYFAFALFSFMMMLSGCDASKNAIAQDPPKPKDPYMTFDNVDHDFGTVKVGESVSHTYTFTNTHKEDITVELISGCDCTDIVYDEGKTYKPGEQGTIKVTFVSTREEERGQLEKTVDILLTNTDPKTGYQIIKEVRYTVNLVE